MNKLFLLASLIAIFLSACAPAAVTVTATTRPTLTSVTIKNNIQTDTFIPTNTPDLIDDIFLVRCEISVEVLQGDKLDVIALNYSVSEEAIMEYNRMESDTLSPGMRLLIPMCRHMPTPTVTPTK